MAVPARVVLCCAVACAACGDALGLHDLSEAHDAGGATEDAGGVPERAPWAESGADSVAAESVPVDGGREAKADEVVETGAAPPADLPVTTESDAASNAMDGRRDAASPMPPQVNDAAGPKPPQAGAAGMGDPAARDADSAVCSACGASVCTTHSNGVGQTFQDCQPSGTYNEMQALEACAAFTGSRATCAVVACAQSGGSGAHGNAGSDQAVCSAGATACDCWTFSGSDVGLVQSTNPNKCEPCSKPGGSAWN